MNTKTFNKGASLIRDINSLSEQLARIESLDDDGDVYLRIGCAGRHEDIVVERFDGGTESKRVLAPFEPNEIKKIVGEAEYSLFASRLHARIKAAIQAEINSLKYEFENLNDETI